MWKMDVDALNGWMVMGEMRGCVLKKVEVGDVKIERVIWEVVASRFGKNASREDCHP
jgi:hypothetical protein